MEGQALPRVLAIDPTSRGFGFVVLEGPATLVDWGVRSVPGNHQRTFVGKVREIIVLYQPDVLVLEDCNAPSTRRRHRVRKLIDEVVCTVKGTGLNTYRVSVRDVRVLFGSNAAKERVATTVAEHFPELAPRLPPKRKIYMSEAERMAIFDAAAFGLTYYFRTDVGDR